ncbi:hypothetical protein [Pedobacter sp. R-06]|uniref:hypothetical protein n=1 Tax=Pedobacter sp. R-06 TaxID=3404051 RepID=UPI003CEF2EBB
MKIQINISVRNPQWYWKEDDYQKTWISINGDKEAKYLPSVTFGFDADIKEYRKPELNQHTFKFTNAELMDAENPITQEVTLDDLDVTEFIDAEGSSYVIVSKSILHHVMAAQNKGRGKFYWYYYINEDAEYVRFKTNIWLSKDHFETLVAHVPNLEFG